MKRLYILFTFSLCHIGMIYAQNFQHEWSQMIGGVNTEYPQDMIYKDGSIYITGGYSDGCDFDPGVGTDIHSAQDLDIFILKKDTSGNELMLITLGGIDFDRANAITLDDSNNIYVIGEFTGTVDFDPGPGLYNMTSAGDEDAFLLKLDPTGNFIWAKQFGGPSYDVGMNIGLDESNNIYLSGTFFETGDFDPGPTSFDLDTGRIFFVKLDMNGDFVWANRISCSSNAYPSKILVDNDYNVYSIGSFGGITDLDPGPGAQVYTPAGVDIYVVKMDISGSLIWADAFGAPGADYALGLVLDDSANLYITGIKDDEPIDFDPGPSTFLLDSGHAFILKLDSANNLVWAHRFLIPSTFLIGNSYSIFRDYNGTLFTVGHFNQPADFDPGPGNFVLDPGGFNSSYICMFDDHGNFMNAAQIRSTSSGVNNGYSVVTDHQGGCYILGGTTTTIDCDPGAGSVLKTSQGFQDLFLVKLHHDDAITPISVEPVHKNNFVLFPNPSNDQFYIKLDKLYPKVQIEMYDITGKMVLSKEAKELDLIYTSIDLVPGIYFVNITCGKERETLKLIIQ